MSHTAAQAREGLEPDLQALFDRVFGLGSGSAHARRAVWQYQGEAAARGARLEVLRHAGQPIATLGTLPDRLFVHGQARASRFTADLGADPTWRSRGVGARLLRDFARAPGLPLAFSVSPDAHRLLTRMGFVELPLQSSFRVLRLEGLLRRRLRLELRDGRLGPILMAAARLVDRLEPHGSSLLLPLWARASQLPALKGGGSSDLIVRPFERFTVEMHALTERLGQTWPVIFSPDVPALIHRYDRHPFHTYRRWALMRAGRPEGYVVWRVFEEPDGLRMATLMTLQVARSELEGARRLLRVGLEALRAEGVFAVRALSGHPFLLEALTREGFFPYGSSPGLLFLPRNEEERTWLSEPWWIGYGTSDAEVG